MLIAPYNPEYEIHFQKIEQTLADNLSGICLAIEHVGSTVVPKLQAKQLLMLSIIKPLIYNILRTRLNN